MRAIQIRKEEMGLHSLGETKDYFEGWYFRLCDPRCSVAVIVGFSPQNSAAPFFIQTTDTLTNRSQWAEFGWPDVVVRQSPFHLTLGSNEFSLTRVKLELPELKELVSLMRRSSNNLNQLTRKVHETGRVYDADLEDISQRQEQLWEGVKEILTQLSKLS